MENGSLIFLSLFEVIEGLSGRINVIRDNPLVFSRDYLSLNQFIGFLSRDYIFCRSSLSELIGNFTRPQAKLKPAAIDV